MIPRTFSAFSWNAVADGNHSHRLHNRDASRSQKVREILPGETIFAGSAQLARCDLTTKGTVCLYTPDGNAN